MCGRYSLFTPPEDLAERFGATFEGFEPTYNAAPGQDLPVITAENPDRATRMRWGFVPEWADDPDGGQINARGETVDEKPTFRAAYRRRRCLVPADGFYEWPEDGSPHRVALDDDRPFAMAGIYERWTGTDEQVGLGAFAGEGEATPRTREVESFAVLTTDPNDDVAGLHHRMAVILDPEAERRWLTDDDPAELIRPYPGDLRTYPVSTAVNDPANDRPELIEPVEA